MLSRGVSRFSLDFFGLTLLTNCVGNHSNLREKFRFRNFLCMRTENHVLQVKFIVSEYAKNSWEPLLSLRTFGTPKTFMYITIFLQFFLSHSTEKFREEPSNVSESFKCQVLKNFIDKKVISRFPVENFLSRPKKFRWGTLRYIRKVRLSKNFLTECLISLFSVEFFSRIMPTKFVGEPPCVSESLGHRILYAQGRALQFSVGFFGLPVLKNFLCNPFNLPENFGNRNFLCMRTENHVLQSIFFVPQYAKVSRELLLSFRIFGISKTFMHITVFLRFFLSHSTEKFLEEPSKVSERFKCQVFKIFLQKNGISRFSVEKCLSRCRKISLGNHSVYQKISAFEKFHD